MRVINSAGIRIWFVICVAAILMSACGGQTALNRQKETTQAEHHTTCLKRGLAADTQAHTECVIALHEERQQRLAQRRGSVEAVQPKDDSGGDMDMPAY